MVPANTKWGEAQHCFEENCKTTPGGKLRVGLEAVATGPGGVLEEERRNRASLKIMTE